MLYFFCGIPSSRQLYLWSFILSVLYNGGAEECVEGRRECCCGIVEQQQQGRQRFPNGKEVKIGKISGFKMGIGCLFWDFLDLFYRFVLHLPYHARHRVRETQDPTFHLWSPLAQVGPFFLILKIFFFLYSFGECLMLVV